MEGKLLIGVGFVKWCGGGGMSVGLSDDLWTVEKLIVLLVDADEFPTKGTGERNGKVHRRADRKSSSGISRRLSMLSKVPFGTSRLPKTTGARASLPLGSSLRYIRWLPLPDDFAS